jgi:hypothetical protein
VIEAYGGECVCCGESLPEFLTVDHTDGGGSDHRRKVSHGSGGTGFYAWLKRHGFPQDGFQLLCFNCNLGRQINGGVCPHQAHVEELKREEVEIFLASRQE